MPEEDKEKIREIEAKLNRRTTNLFVALWFGGLFCFASVVQTWFPDDVGLALFIGGWAIPFVAWMIAKNV
jgi:hypothetical protein